MQFSITKLTADKAVFSVLFVQKNEQNLEKIQECDSVTLEVNRHTLEVQAQGDTHRLTHTREELYARARAEVLDLNWARDETSTPWWRRFITCIPL
jgi:hypothetical protein